METLETLAARLETTRDIQSIVRTMKALSAVSIQQYERAVAALADYQWTIDRGLQVVLRDRVLHPAAFPADRPSVAGGLSGVIVIGSDRGLCGRFNEAIAEFARRQFLETAGPDGPPPLICAIGLRAAARLDAAGFPPDEIRELPGSVGGLVQSAQSVIIQIDRWQREQGVSQIHLAYNRRTEASRARPGRTRLTPVARDHLDRLARAPWSSRSLPTFSMEPQALFSWLISQHLFLGVYRALAESLASEHAARLAAMQAADRNIAEKREEIETDYRQKRQETITLELMDVVAGFESTKEPE